MPNDKLIFSADVIVELKNLYVAMRYAEVNRLVVDVVLSMKNYDDMDSQERPMGVLR